MPLSTKAKSRSKRPYLSHPTLLPLLLPHLSSGDKKYLRCVSRHIRDELDKHWTSVTVWRSRMWVAAEHLAAAGARFPGLRHINAVALNINDDTLRSICAVPWANLESIELGDNALTERAGRHLAVGGAAAWPALTRLSLANNKLGDEGLEFLVAAQWPQLAELDVSHNSLTTKAGAMLAAAAASRWPHLRVLNLSGNALGPIGIKSLLSTRFYELEELRLGGNALGFLGAVALGTAAKDNTNNLPCLKILDVSSCGIGPEPAAWVDGFFQGEWDHLQELILAGNPVGGEAAASLGVFSWRLPALRRLVLDGATIHENGLQRLVGSPWYVLEELSLRDVTVIGSAATELGKAPATQFREEKPRIPLLRRLDLTNSGIHNEALKALLLNVWPCLEFLNLKGCGLGHHGMKTLARNVLKLPALTELRISSTADKILNSKALAALFENEWPALQRVRVDGLDSESNTIRQTIENIHKHTGIEVIREGRE